MPSTPASPPASQDYDHLVSRIARNPLFDRDWYLAHTPGARLSQLPPAYHYLWIGAPMGCDPGPDFDTAFYLAAHPKVKETRTNPLLHFEDNGQPMDQPPAMKRADPSQMIAASTAVTRDWCMTPDEAAGVMAGLLAATQMPTRLQRLLPSFDALRARRYAAAAEVLYDSACAAMTVSVIMPTFNRADRIEAAIRSVLDQSHQKLELLIIDDGSTDETRDRLVQYDDDSRVRVFWNDHGGVSAARNTGLEHATGDIIFYLDSDNTWTPDHVKLMLVGLQASGANCAYAASCLVNRTGDLVGYRGEPFDWQACLTKNYVDMNVFAHRAELTRTLGGFDTDLRRVVDWDLILRYTRGHEVAFLPFIGCRYTDDMTDQSRISVSEPMLLRKVVIEKHLAHLTSATDAAISMRLSFGIKIAAVRSNRDAWGDFHYADSLAEALERLGHSVRIDFRGEWHCSAAHNDDIALVLRGLVGYKPHPGQMTLMWNISHPDQISYAEYDGCDQIFVASSSYAALLSIILDRPVHVLEQCTDTARFHLPADGLLPEPAARGLFVGNSRLEYRDMVRWSVENDIAVDIYGGHWEELIPSHRITGTNLPNRDLAEKYRSASFVLNDHWQAMKDFGFVSNRVFDVLACGGHLISDKLYALNALFGDVIDTVTDEEGFLNAVVRPPADPAQRRTVANYVRDHHSFDVRARTLLGTLQRALVPTLPAPLPSPRLGQPRPRRRVGLLLQRGRAWWTSSAYIRLIGPLTSDYAHAVAGLDLTILDGPEDPRLDSCDVCIVQRVAVADCDAARQLVARLRARNIPLYVDTDDAFFLHTTYRAADDALRLLMAAAREVWFSTLALATLYDDVAAPFCIRPNALDPRFWRDYRTPVNTAFTANKIRFIYMGTTTHHDDLTMVLPAFERLAQTHPGQFDLTLVGVTATPPQADWLRVLSLPREAGGYPAFARFITRERAFDVGIAPLTPTDFNAAKSDIKFLDYSAMGLLSVVSDGPVYRDCIEENLAIGCATSEEAWYSALSAVIANPSEYAAMRQRAADHVWIARNALTDPAPLADRLV